MVTAFQSAASQLVPGDRNGYADVFARSAGNLARASRRLSGAEARVESVDAALSETGRYLVFISRDDLLENDSGGNPTAFWIDALTGTLLGVALNSSGQPVQASNVAISGSGRFVVFESANASIVAGDTNAVSDVFRFDTVTATTVRISTGAAGVQGNGGSFEASVDDSGNLIAFASSASNFVAGDTSGSDIFVKNVSSGAIGRASQTTAGVGAIAAAFDADLARTGAFVVFHSVASNLDPSDGNGTNDVFRHTLLTGVTERVSLGFAGADTNGPSSGASVSAGGRYVWFQSSATNLTAMAPATIGQIYRRDLLAGITEQASNGNRSAQLASASDDGQRACFQSKAALEAVDSNGLEDIYVKDLNTAALTRESVANAPVPSVFGAGDSGLSDLAPNAARVLALSQAPDLDTASFGQALDSVHLAEIIPETGAIRLLARNPSNELPNFPVEAVSLSADGNWVALETFASNLAANDANGSSDSYRLNLQSGALNLVSVNTSGTAAGGTTPNLDGSSKININGSRIVFVSSASNIVAGDSNAVADAFLWVSTAAVPIRRVSVASSGAQANGAVTEISLDRAGNVLAFTTSATNLALSDTNARADVYMDNLGSGLTSRVSLDALGVQFSGASGTPSVSPDGRFVAFSVDGAAPAGGMYIYDSILQTRERVQPLAGVAPLINSIRFGADSRYLSYIGRSAGQDVAWRYDRFAALPNLELVRTSDNPYLRTFLSGLRLASATQAVIETNQPLSDADRNGATDLLLVTLQAGNVSFPAATLSVPESAGEVNLPLLRLGGTEGTISVSSTTVAGSAGSSDFGLTVATVSWPNAVAAIQNLRIEINNDRLREGDETFTVQLTEADGGATLGLPSSLVITIVDDEAVDLLFADGFGG